MTRAVDGGGPGQKEGAFGFLDQGEDRLAPLQREAVISERKFWVL